MNLSAELEQLIQGKGLSPDHIKNIFESCLQGELSDIQLAAFLVLMRMKGETAEELSAAAETLLAAAETIDLGDKLIDIVGTGGDGKSTFNVSTISAVVAAASGLKVAKHGNLSVSSRSGSADFLRQAGFNLKLSPEALKTSLDTCGIAFLFAPQFHPALQYARSARQQLGIRTMFNLLGPLLNPAQVKTQVIGVFPSQWLQPIAQVAVHLGRKKALIVSSQDGLDEISIGANTDVIEYRQGKYTHWEINPAHFGFKRSTLDNIVANDAAQSLSIAESIFSGEQSSARDIVILNAAAAIYIYHENLSYADAIDKASAAIDSGDAWNCFIQAKRCAR